MPIKIPNDLPAFEKLQQEGVRLIGENEALRQDVRPMQVALLNPEQGPQIRAAMNGEVFMAGLAPTFPEGYDSAADVASIWQSFHLHNGQKNAHLLIRYIEDR